MTENKVARLKYTNRKLLRQVLGLAKRLKVLEYALESVLGMVAAVEKDFEDPDYNFSDAYVHINDLRFAVYSVRLGDAEARNEYAAQLERNIAAFEPIIASGKYASGHVLHEDTLADMTAELAEFKRRLSILRGVEE